MLTPAALLALAIQCAPSVHPDTLTDIARTESGFHPYAIAEIIPLKGGGSRVVSHHPASREAALTLLEEIKAKKHRYSVGMMQITSTNFPGFGVTAEEMLSPCKNLSVAEKIITDCYLRGGTLKRALSCYYSGNFETGQRPEKPFSNTSYIQRIGYVVPSTKAERQATSPSSDGTPGTATTVYPDRVIRGALPSDNTIQTSDLYYPPQIVRGGTAASVQ
ncbi:lytic transglycosylase domain-containing protein [Enterobacter cloacae]|uniref:lytic transglycosylase domain-containing protein n=1 Tax=Enterobacter cloacae TaxID=550 RepID=UPI002FFBA00B